MGSFTTTTRAHSQATIEEPLGIRRETRMYLFAATLLTYLYLAIATGSYVKCAMILLTMMPFTWNEVRKIRKQTHWGNGIAVFYGALSLLIGLSTLVFAQAWMYALIALGLMLLSLFTNSPTANLKVAWLAKILTADLTKRT